MSSRDPLQKAVDETVRRLVTSRRQGPLNRLVCAMANLVPWEAWERNGVHLTRADFYSPIPDTRELNDLVWTRRSELPGIDLREDAQVDLLRRLTKEWGEEFNALPREGDPDDLFTFHLDNKTFERVDSEVFYALIREHKPKRIIEIGSGWSTVLALAALRRNAEDGAPGRLLAIEPYPSGVLVKLADDDLVDVVDAPLQHVPRSTFESLEPGDFLFIDSTHVCRIGSDVQYELLEVLPRLPAGVLVHVHDIFLPGEYPKDWILEHHRGWNEQYVLQALLARSDWFEVVWAGAHMARRYPDLLAECVTSFDPGRVAPGSFWLRTGGAG